MKTQKIKKLSFVILLVLVISLVIAASALAASKNYNGLTTVYYFNYIDDYTGWWNPRYWDTTSPSRSMDQFGVSFWSAYNNCDGEIEYSTYNSYTGMIRYNQSSISDVMAKSNFTCAPEEIYRGHNYIQH